MRICVASKWAEGAWFAWLLKQGGHDVTLAVEEESCRGAFKGLLDVVESAGDPASYDLVVFDTASDGKEADAVRLATPTLGSSSFADQLEHDRVFGLQFMEKCGIRVPPWEHFTDISEGIRYIKKSTKALVFKPCGDGADTSTTYVSKSPNDLLEYIEILYKKNPQKEFVLQEFTPGTEVSTEMWMNQKGYYAVNLTFETKKMMTGDIGPATGCSGNLVYMPHREPRVFQRGLKKAYGALQEAGYVGMIDLNAIVTDEDVFGLEWTPRFGYEGTCNLTRLLPVEFGKFLYSIAANEVVPEILPRHPFCASIRLGIPPYPLVNGPNKVYREGVTLGGVTPKTLESFYARDIRTEEHSQDRLESAGLDGWIGAAMGVGPSIHAAFSAVHELIKSLSIPDLMYRNDIESCVVKRFLSLEKDGWLRSEWGQ